jgi:hypothetical protein
MVISPWSDFVKILVHKSYYRRHQVQQTASCGPRWYYGLLCNICIECAPFEKRSKHRCWVHGFLKKQRAYITLLNDLRLEEGSFGFNNYVRISPEDFELLLDLVRPLTEKKYLPFRDAIPAQESLMVTLWFLTTGDSYSNLMYVYRISKSSFCNMWSHNKSTGTRDIPHQIKTEKRYSQTKPLRTEYFFVRL